MAFQKFFKAQGGHKTTSPAISVGSGNISFNATLADDSIQDRQMCEVFIDKANERLGFKFHYEKAAPHGCYKIFGQNANRGRSRLISCRALINEMHIEKGHYDVFIDNSGMIIAKVMCYEPT